MTSRQIRFSWCSYYIIAYKHQLPIIFLCRFYKQALRKIKTTSSSTFTEKSTGVGSCHQSTSDGETQGNPEGNGKEQIPLSEKRQIPSD